MPAYRGSLLFCRVFSQLVYLVVSVQGQKSKQMKLQYVHMPIPNVVVDILQLKPELRRSEM